MKLTHLLLLADRPDDLRPVSTQTESGFTWEFCVDPAGFATAAEREGLGGIVCISRLWSGDAIDRVLKTPSASRCPVLVLLSEGDRTAHRQAELMAAGALDVVSTDEPWRIATALDHLLAKCQHAQLSKEKERRAEFVHIVEQLSLARSMATVMAIVRTAARQLTQADGATFVLRDNGQCYYADEDAIAPLWKGQHFPLSRCVSGWAMLHRQPVVIDNIFEDSRIPVAAYEPTFVRSLVMVPIRMADPIGAIGTYWARPRQPTSQEVELLQALADTTSVAIENVQLQETLERRVHERTKELQFANEELEAFSSSVSHDLRNPLNAIDGFSALLEMDLTRQSEAETRQQLRHVREAAKRMGAIINDLLTLARASRGVVRRDKVDLSAMAGEVAAHLRRASPQRQVEVRIAPGVIAECDPGLVRIALENLLSNAWKYSAKKPVACIEFGTEPGDAACDPMVFHVTDNGAGFDPAKAVKLFKPFQRLHPESEFPGVGVGLTTVRRVVQRHGGQVWATATPGQGACFSFTLKPMATQRPPVVMACESDERVSIPGALAEQHHEA